MIPRLLAFYGPAPHVSGDWAEVPTRLLGMYARALPALEAHRQLNAVNAIRLGFADSDDANVRNAVRSLEIAARGGRQVPGAKATMASMAEFGISVETIE